VVAAVAGVGILAGLASAASPVLGVAVVVVVVLAALSVLRPDDVSVLIVAVIYSNAVVVATQLHGVPRVFAVGVPVALAVPLAHRLLVRRQPLVIVRALPVLVVFGAIQAASTLGAVTPGVSIDKMAEFLTEGLALFLLVTNTVVGADQVRRAVWALLFVGGALGALSLLQSVTGTYGQDYLGFAQISDATVGVESDPTAAVPRLAGPIGETNRYAQVMLVLFPLGLVQALGGATRRVRLLSAVATALIATGVVLTFSRGAAVGLAVVLVVAVAMRILKVRWLLLVAGCLAAVLPFVPAYAQRLATLGEVADAGNPFASRGVDGAIQGRLSENLSALAAMREHPLLGVGPGGFPSVYQRYVRDLGIRPHEGEREAHNLYVGTGAELGLLGLACFLAVVAVVLRDLLRARRLLAATDPGTATLAAGFVLALVAHLASGLFLHQAFQRYFWLLLALAACAAAVAQVRAGPTNPAATPRPGRPD
jgi:O-antigen ligase